MNLMTIVMMTMTMMMMMMVMVEDAADDNDDNYDVGKKMMRTRTYSACFCSIASIRGVGVMNHKTAYQKGIVKKTKLI